MKIKKIVKVMNFQTLLKINSAKRQAELYQNVGKEVTNILKTLVYNKNLILDKNMIEADPTKPVLNVYIANDYGFCGNFNASVRHQIMEDKDAYKIIIGKKILYKDDKTLLKIEKDHFQDEIANIEKIINKGLENNEFSEINLYYNHYYSYTQFGFLKLKLFPIDVPEDYYDESDFVSETDIDKMIKGIVSFYICYQIKMAESISIAAENVLRNQITNMALDRIEEQEIIENNEKRKEKLSKTIVKNVENYKRIMESEEVWIKT